MKRKIEFVTPVRSNDYDPGWSRMVCVGGVRYWLGVRSVKRVRIAYKPRGQNIGHVWQGFMNDIVGHPLWADRVGGSLGARGLLARAGIIEKNTEA